MKTVFVVFVVTVLLFKCYLSVYLECAGVVVSVYVESSRFQHFVMCLGFFHSGESRIVLRGVCFLAQKI